MVMEALQIVLWVPDMCIVETITHNVQLHIVDW